ncbi:MAG: HutD family protein [Dokdonella sp.]
MSDSTATLLRAADSRRVRWKNGGGWTREIAVASDATTSSGPEPSGIADGFRWRISIAEIEQDGPFSVFPGIDRELLLLNGNGIELAIDDQSPLRLDRPLQAVRFTGEQRVHCRLIDGPTRDFNVMVRRSAFKANVRARRLENLQPITLASNRDYLIHVVEGTLRASFAGAHLAATNGDSVRIATGNSPESMLMLDGCEQVIVVELEELQF